MVENGSHENPGFTPAPEKEDESFPKKRSSGLSTKKIDLSSDLPEKPTVSDIFYFSSVQERCDNLAVPTALDLFNIQQRQFRL